MADVIYVSDVAAKLGTSTDAVRMRIYRGSILPPFRLGRRLAWRQVDFDQWLEREARAAMAGGAR